MTVGARLKEFRSKLKISQIVFSNTVGITQSAVSQVEKNMISISSDILKNISEAYNLNINWLLTGKGQMFLTDSPGEEPPKVKYLDDSLQSAEQWRKKKNQEFMEQFKKIKDYSKCDIIPDSVIDDVWDMPVVGDISAGEPLPVFYTEDMKYIPVSKRIVDIPDNYFCFRVNGDSMHPEINHNDYVIISKVYNYDDLDGRIIAVRSSEGITLKRLLIDYKHELSLLFPINQRFKPILLDDTSEIIGVIKILFRKYY